jgi:hypothetical protein
MVRPLPLPVVYDPRYQEWDNWCGLMIEAYAAQNLQIGVPEEKWKDWAAGLMAIDVFQNESIPNPYLYENWQDWAAEVINAVSPRN